MAYKIFISHSSYDKPWVDWIAKNAMNFGIVPYLYEYDIQPGKSIAQKVKEEIRKSNAFVVLITANSQFSNYVQQEIGVAEGFGKRIIPLVQPGISEDILAMLKEREYIPFDFNNPNEAVSKLLAYLQKQKEIKQNDFTFFLVLAAIIVVALLFLGNK